MNCLYGKRLTKSLKFLSNLKLNKEGEATKGKSTK